MSKKLTFAIVLLLVAAILAGCAQPAAPTAAPPAEPAGAPEEVALTVKGKVGQELALSLDGFKALGTVQVTAEHPKNGPQEYEGVLLDTILSKAAVQDGATELAMTASDGFESTVALADLEGCENCLVALGQEDSLSMVLPGQSTKAWVKDVVTIEIK